MEQRAKRRSSQLFIILTMIVGAILILSAIVGGISFVISLVKGLVGHTLKDVRALILDIVLEFCVPLIGGIMLIFSGVSVMRNESAVFDRQIVSSTRRKVVKQKEQIINVFLNPDEKRVMELAKEDRNGALQSDLVIKTGYSKVKMHRILKSLENKGLIKRGRHGITNKVLVNRY